MLDLDGARRQYETDPEFRALVTHMELAIVKLQFTPGELRAAATFAAVRVEERKPPPTRPMFFGFDPLSPPLRFELEDPKANASPPEANPAEEAREDLPD